MQIEESGARPTIAVCPSWLINLDVTATSMRRTLHCTVPLRTIRLTRRARSPLCPRACCCCSCSSMLLPLSSAFASPYMVEPPPPRRLDVRRGRAATNDPTQKESNDENRCTLLGPASDTRAHGKAPRLPFPTSPPTYTRFGAREERTKPPPIGYGTAQCKFHLTGSGAAIARQCSTPAVRSSSSCGCDGRFGVRRRRGAACTYCSTPAKLLVSSIPSVARFASLWIFGESEELGLARLGALTQSCLLDRTNDSSSSPPPYRLLAYLRTPNRTHIGQADNGHGRPTTATSPGSSHESISNTLL
jgi:hypothetical protein